MKNQIKAMAVLLVFLASLLPVAIAGNTTDDFNIVKIELDDHEFMAPFGDEVFGPVYAGDNFEIEVFWEASENLTDETEAKIRVELADVEEETDFFTVRPGWEGSEKIVLELDPSVFDEDDANADDEVVRRLHIEMEDEDGNRMDIDSFKIRIVNKRESVQVFDVNFPNGREVKAGQVLQANIGVKNLGHTEQEDVLVSMSIPELGISTRSDRFDLHTERRFNEDAFDDDDFQFKLYRTLFLQIPLNTVSGVYDVDVEVEYDDGDKVDRETFSVVVSSGVAPSDAVINIADTSQEVAQGKGTVYKLMFANLGNQAGTYTVELSGVSNWGTARVDPQTITVGPDETKEVFIFVSANEDANLGTQNFQAKVKRDNTAVKTFDLQANVVKETGITDITNVKDGLQIGFLILLVILVILGIILVAKRLGKNGKEEPFVEEDQTYY